MSILSVQLQGLNSSVLGVGRCLRSELNGQAPKYTAVQVTTVSLMNVCSVLHAMRDSRRLVALQEILDANVQYVKIFTEGHSVPSAAVQQT